MQFSATNLINNSTFGEPHQCLLAVSWKRMLVIFYSKITGKVGPMNNIFYTFKDFR